MASGGSSIVSYITTLPLLQYDRETPHFISQQKRRAKFFNLATFFCCDKQCCVNLRTAKFTQVSALVRCVGCMSNLLYYMLKTRV